MQAQEATSAIELGKLVPHFFLKLHFRGKSALSRQVSHGSGSMASGTCDGTHNYKDAPGRRYTSCLPRRRDGLKLGAKHRDTQQPYRAPTSRALHAPSLVCMPHSFSVSFSHHQRPARSSSQSNVARVHGAQPILLKPFAYNGCTGTSCSRV